MDQLKQLRAEKGLSQAKLAALADIDPSTVNQIERGAREASPATLRKLAQALDVSLYELIEGEPRPLEQPRLPEVSEAERRGESHVYRFDPEPRITVEQLREYGIEASNSEVIVLNQYIQVEERPPTGIVAVGHVVKEGEPVDHERVKGILAYVLAKDLLPPEQAEAVGETLREELAGARS